MKNWLYPVLLLLLFLLSGCSKTDSSLQEWLDLGQKYLLEGKYEEAVVEFEKVISVDEKNAEAYEGLAKAYIGQGDEQSAREILEKGYEVTQDPVLLEEAEALGTEREPDSLSPETSEENTEGEEFAMVEAEPSEFLDRLSEMLVSGDYEKAGEQLFSPEMDELLEKKPSVLFPLSGDPIAGSGSGIGLYSLEDGERCIYFGDFENSRRNGHGIWTWAPGAVFDGEWSEDAPNGKGMLYYIGGSSLEGNLKNGRWDGDIMHNSEGMEETCLVFKDGYPVIRGTIEDAEKEEPYTLIMSKEGYHIYTCSPAQAEIPWGVNGFVPELPF